MNASKYLHVVRATPRRNCRSSGPSSTFLRGIGCESRCAMSGAKAHSASTGAAATSAAGRVTETRTSPPSAIAGLAAISTKYDRGPLPRLRAPLAAAVSHSSSRRLRDREADERDDDRVRRRVGLVREERELERDAGEGAPRVLREGAQERPERLVPPRAGEGP